MRIREGFTLIELMIVVVIIGILAAIAIPNYIRMQDNAKEARTKSHGHGVQLAIEDYGVLNDGNYSDNAGDLLPLLPGGALLENAFTRVASEPQFGVAATTPGQVGVQVVVVAGLAQGYTVSCFGADRMVLTLRAGQ